MEVRIRDSYAGAGVTLWVDGERYVIRKGKSAELTAKVGKEVLDRYSKVLEEVDGKPKKKASKKADPAPETVTPDPTTEVDEPAAPEGDDS